jgi:hypothetical protein
LPERSFATSLVQERPFCSNQSFSMLVKLDSQMRNNVLEIWTVQPVCSCGDVWKYDVVGMLWLRSTYVINYLSTYLF